MKVEDFTGIVQTLAQTKGKWMYSAEQIEEICKRIPATLKISEVLNHMLMNYNSPPIPKTLINNLWKVAHAAKNKKETSYPGCKLCHAGRITVPHLDAMLFAGITYEADSIEHLLFYPVTRARCVCTGHKDIPNLLEKMKEIKDFHPDVYETAYLMLYAYYRLRDSGINSIDQFNPFEMFGVGFGSNHVISHSMLRWHNRAVGFRDAAPVKVTLARFQKNNVMGAVS